MRAIARTAWSTRSTVARATTSSGSTRRKPTSTSTARPSRRSSPRTRTTASKLLRIKTNPSPLSERRSAPQRASFVNGTQRLVFRAGVFAGMRRLGLVIIGPGTVTGAQGAQAGADVVAKIQVCASVFRREGGRSWSGDHPHRRGGANRSRHEQDRPAHQRGRWPVRDHRRRGRRLADELPGGDGAADRSPRTPSRPRSVGTQPATPPHGSARPGSPTSAPARSSASTRRRTASCGDPRRRSARRVAISRSAVWVGNFAQRQSPASSCANQVVKRVRVVRSRGSRPRA